MLSVHHFQSQLKKDRPPKRCVPERCGLELYALSLSHSDIVYSHVEARKLATTGNILVPFGITTVPFFISIESIQNLLVTALTKLPTL